MRRRRLHRRRVQCTLHPGYSAFGFDVADDGATWVISAPRHHFVRVNSRILRAYRGRPPVL